MYGKGFFQAKHDVQEIDAFSPEVVLDDGFGFDFFLVNAECVHQNDLDLVVDFFTRHKIVLLSLVIGHLLLRHGHFSVVQHAFHRDLVCDR